MTSGQAAIETLLRDASPHVLTALARRHADFGACEDAVQEALLAAAAVWSTDGIPTNPTGWLITTASRRYVDVVRNESARSRREHADAVAQRSSAPPGAAVDDTLTLLFLCCHPSLTQVSQMALTLRALGGLTTAEIARALLVPEATVGQRISRAKARIATSGARFGDVVTAPDRAHRLPAVLGVLYLIFNEGYAATSGESVLRVDLTAEAIRLSRQLHAELPNEGEVAGLLALMLLTDARRPARCRQDGGLIPLAEQDRSHWNADEIAEGVALISATLPTATPGPFQLQAAIAAVHDEAARAQDTDWPQIRALYDVLAVLAPGPMVTLNRIVAIAMVDGPRIGLDSLQAVADAPGLEGHHRVDAVRAHLLDEVGDHRAAREAYLRAAERTLSLPEQRYLLARAGRLSSDG